MERHLNTRRGAFGVPIAGGSATREAIHRTCSSPATHSIVKRLLVSTRVVSPVMGSRLVDMALRAESCSVAACGAVLFVFMARIFEAPSIPVHVQKQEIRT